MTSRRPSDCWAAESARIDNETALHRQGKIVRLANFRDIVVLLNVLEHIGDDEAAMGDLGAGPRQLLGPAGRRHRVGQGRGPAFHQGRRLRSGRCGEGIGWMGQREHRPRGCEISGTAVCPLQKCYPSRASSHQSPVEYHSFCVNQVTLRSTPSRILQRCQPGGRWAHCRER